MKKKLLSLVLCLALAFTMMPYMGGQAYGEDNTPLYDVNTTPSATIVSSVYGTISYTYDKNTKNLTISGTGDFGTMEDHTTPLFADTDFNQIIIGEGITKLRPRMFYNVKANSVSMPSTLTEILTDSFVRFVCGEKGTGYTVATDNMYFTALNGSLYSKDMTQLYLFGGSSKSYETPSTLNLVYDGAFFGRTFDSLTFGGSELEIRTYSIRECYADKLIFNEGVKNIGPYSDIKLPKGTVLNVPSTVEYIGDQGLFSDQGIKAITVSPDNKNYISIDGVLCQVLSEDSFILVQYPAGKELATYITPANVRKIEVGAIKNNPYLKKLVLSEDALVIVRGSITLSGSEENHAKVVFTRSDHSINKEAFNHMEDTYVDFYGPKGGFVESYFDNKNIEKWTYIEHKHPDQDAMTNIIPATMEADGSGQICSICEARQSIPKVAKVELNQVEYNYSEIYSYCPNLEPVLDAEGKTLVEGTDYDVAGLEPQNKAGSYDVTITFKGNYAGTVTRTFTINPKSIEDRAATAENVKYSGNQQKQPVTIAGLDQGIDYVVTYPQDCTNVGTKEVEIKGIGNYTGTIKTTYSITPASPKSVKLEIAKYAYNGKVKTPAVVAYNNLGKKLVKGTDYTVTYASGRKAVGKYKVTVKFKGNYQGTKTLYFTIVPATPAVKAMTAGTRSLKVTMTTKPVAKGASTYQIAYRVKGTSSWKYTTTTSGAKTIKSLKKGKVYQVKVRAYKTVNNVKYYSDWTAIKTSKGIK